MLYDRRIAKRWGWRRKLWTCLALGLLLLLAVTFLAFRKSAVQIGSVPIQYFKEALDDVTEKQPQLCKGLGQLQSYLSSAALWGTRASQQWAEEEGSGEPMHRMQPKLYLEANGVVLTSYFVKTEDPLYHSNPGRQSISGSSFGYMDLWYRTAFSLDLPAVVFHDGLDAAFTQRWTSKNIKFIQVDLTEGFHSANDARFIVFMDWLKCCASVDYVLITDLRDSRFARDPFHLFRALPDYDLFVNTDRNNWWMRDRFEEVGYKRPKLPVILNAGVVGGRKQAMMGVLQNMVKEFLRIYKSLLSSGKTHISNIDMAVLNYVLLEVISKQQRIFTGAPFAGGQAQCELFFQCDYFVYHKWVQPGELSPCKRLTNLDLDAQLANPQWNNSNGVKWRT